LETSFVSACVTNRDDIASLYRKQVSTDWWSRQRAEHDVLISAEVSAELSSPRYPHRDAALGLIDSLDVLAITEDVRGLARILVDSMVMPGPPDTGDAIHVAVATVHRCDYILSWNVQHLANVNKVRHLRTICRRVGYVPPEIVTPDILRGDE
jgi:hypothetical protein